MGSLLLAVDPGRHKIGLAILSATGELLRRSVVSPLSLTQDLQSFLGAERSQLATVVIGDGTGAERVAARVRELIGQGPRFETVDESDSTTEAKQLFYREFPPQGLLRFLPRGLWPDPDMPLDGFAAEVLGRRWLSRSRSTEAGLNRGSAP